MEDVWVRFLNLSEPGFAGLQDFQDKRFASSNDLIKLTFCTLFKVDDACILCYNIIQILHN